LKDFGDRMPAASRGFPMDLVEAIAGRILAQLFKFAPAPDLPQGANAADSAPERFQFAITSQIGIHANFERDGIVSAHRPGSRRRRSFKKTCIDLIAPPPARCNRPGKLSSVGARG